MRVQSSAVLALLGGLAAFVSAAPRNYLQPRCECTPAITDELVFQVSMSTFQQRRNAKDPACCDWSSDNCSSSPDRPLGYDFVPACQRHDFGYRNSKKQNRFTEDLRKRIDDNFKEDLYYQCAQYGDNEDDCRIFANIYYTAVRLCGDGNCLGKESVSS
ncbi:hypothetical protein VTO42DRAFT_1345 [Malbranchea cinnamomea]